MATFADVLQNRPLEKFNCRTAGNLVRQGNAAQTAGDNVRSVKLWQQAIEAYELCDNATSYDKMTEAWTMISVAAQFQTDGDLTRARSMYNGVFGKMVILCIQADRLSGQSLTTIGFEILLYRKNAEPLGSPSLDEACGGAFPRPSPSP